MERDHDFWLRLVVARVEGLLLPFPEELFEGAQDGFSDAMFPDWARSVDRDQAELRGELTERAETDKPPEEDLVEFLRQLSNHTPVRIGLLTPGPNEWGELALGFHDMEDEVDYLFTYDNYVHADRDIQLQFLMNRFVAGRQRTLLIGSSPVDQQVAHRQEARFRSPLTPADDVPEPEEWGQELWELKEYVDSIKPEE